MVADVTFPKREECQVGRKDQNTGVFSSGREGINEELLVPKDAHGVLRTDGYP